MRRMFWIAGMVLAVLGLFALRPARPRTVAAVSSYLETFDGMPAAPAPFDLPDFGIDRHVDDPSHAAAPVPVTAQHGSDCAAYPATHLVSTWADSVFQCHDHVMTALFAQDGYGMTYLTPPAMADFTDGPATVSFDISTLRTSDRDWFDLWVTPWDDAMTMPLETEFPDGQGAPDHTVHIRLDNGTNGSIFRLFVGRGQGNLQEIGVSTLSIEDALATRGLTPDATRRDTFRLTLTRTHITFAMPAYGVTFFDQDVADVGFSQGVVQFGHHSYNPTKDGGSNYPDTWHWDTFAISPAAPFTMLKGDRRTVGSAGMNLGGPAAVTFPAPAPAGAVLRFHGLGDSISVSFDGGATWLPAGMHHPRVKGPENVSSYWMPIPAGTVSVTIKGSGWYGTGPDGPWLAQDFAVWAPGGKLPPPTPSPMPTMTMTPTVTPLPTPSPSPSPTPSPAPTPAPALLIGRATVAGTHDSDDPGMAEAFRQAASAAGTLAALAVYLDGQNTAGTVVVGLYAEAGGHPGTLLTQGTITGARAGTWNTVGVPPVSVQAGVTYWLAVLQPAATGGSLGIRDTSTRSVQSETSGVGLTALPATWTPGASWNSGSVSMKGMP